jgi:hypothetical protein
MAKRRESESNFAFEVLSKEDAERSVTRLSARRSKYQPVAQRAEGLKGNEVLSFTGTQSDVQGARNYLNRMYGNQFEVTSRKSGDNNYRIYVTRADGGEQPKRRGRRRKSD